MIFPKRLTDRQGQTFRAEHKCTYARARISTYRHTTRIFRHVVQMTEYWQTGNTASRSYCCSHTSRLSHHTASFKAVRWSGEELQRCCQSRYGNVQGPTSRAAPSGYAMHHHSQFHVLSTQLICVLRVVRLPYTRLTGWVLYHRRFVEGRSEGRTGQLPRETRPHCSNRRYGAGIPRLSTRKRT